MDVTVIRRTNLQQLVDREGSLKAVADRAGVNYDYLSSILSPNGKRNAGRALMRRIENAYSLESGSLDLPEATGVTAAMAINDLPDEDRQAVFDFIRYKIESAGPLVTSQATAKAYLEMIDRLKGDLHTRKNGGHGHPPKKK